MALRKWVDIEVAVAAADFNEFEEWCESHRLRFNHRPLWGDYATVRARSLGAVAIPSGTFARTYKVWGKYPDKIMLCKLTWVGRYAP